jgi:hypothetical protein
LEFVATTTKGKDVGRSVAGGRGRAVHASRGAAEATTQALVVERSVDLALDMKAVTHWGSIYRKKRDKEGEMVVREAVGAGLTDGCVAHARSTRRLDSACSLGWI